MEGGGQPQQGCNSLQVPNLPAQTGLPCLHADASVGVHVGGLHSSSALAVHLCHQRGNGPEEGVSFGLQAAF